MKKSLIFTSLIIIYYTNLLNVSGQKASLKPYGIKSGIIDYSYSGVKVGKGTLYFDDYGLKSAMYTDAVEGGEKIIDWVVTSGDYQYMWNPDRSTGGVKLKNHLLNWIATASNGDISSFSESMYIKMGMEKMGTEIMLGKECQILQGKMGKVLIWNGILMLLDMNIMGSHSHQEAIKIETNTPVDAKKFIIPGNIKFSEMPGF